MAVSLTDQFMNTFFNVHQFVYEKSGGRVGAKLAGRPMLLLRTTGRRSGKARTAPLLYVRDGDDYVVIASTNGGDQHPGWYFNLKDHAPAEVQVGRMTVAVTATDATDDSRERMWAEADRVNRGGYTKYQTRTERHIPVVVLSPT